MLFVVLSDPAIAAGRSGAGFAAVLLVVSDAAFAADSSGGSVRLCSTVLLITKGMVNDLGGVQAASSSLTLTPSPQRSERRSCWGGIGPPGTKKGTARTQA